MREKMQMAGHRAWHTVYPGLPSPRRFTSCSSRAADTFSTEPMCQDDDGINQILKLPGKSQLVL